MPEAWREKDERQYQYVKDSAIERGRNKEQASEIAARTVNKQRRIEGQTPYQTTSGTGNPNTELKDRTRDELYNRARGLEITGRSKMNKSQLVEAIQNATK